jgi:signal recognition particle subunit SRP54
MFSSLSNSFTSMFDRLRSKGVLTEADIDQAMRDIRIALLEADVALPAVREFIAGVKEKALGADKIKGVSTGHNVVKIVNDELINILTSDEQKLNLSSNPPAVVMMLGLQGSGKTTSSAKLALYLRKNMKKKVLLASLDVYRPAAQKQLEILGKELGIDSLEIVEGQKPLEITERALKAAKIGLYDVLILDTAGRLHTDEDLMNELIAVKKLSNPVEGLLVVDALTGQDAVNIGKEFHLKVGITGAILTRVDGDARGGAALSMRVVTGKPIKFIGVGERLNEFEEFHPERAASRILDMGDVLSLIEKASTIIDEEEAKKLEKKLKKGDFDLNDLLAQIKNMKKMGGITSILSMIPGMGKVKQQLAGVEMDDKVFAKQEAIIYSMTKKERSDPKIINAARKIRIAKGSGTQVQDVNKLLKSFAEMSNMMKRFGKMDKKQLARLGRPF